MELTVLLFGPAALAVGSDRIVMDAGPEPRAAAVLAGLGKLEPRLRNFVAPGTGRLAVNRAFAGPDQVLRAGDEVALIAMVSGG